MNSDSSIANPKCQPIPQGQLSNNSRILKPMSSLASEFIGKFKDIDLSNAPSVEPAMLAPFCAQGDFLNISGPAGCGKTSIALDLLLAATHPGRNGAALGGLFQFPAEPFGQLKSVIVDAETSQARWTSRLALKSKQEALDPLQIGSIRYMQPGDVMLNQRSERADRSRALAEAFGEDQRTFVIIDTLGMAWAPENMNDPDWVFGGLAHFRNECRRYGICVVALTHTRRPSDHGSAPVGPIGTSYQENQADAQIIVSRLKGGQPGIRLTHIKSRRSFWIQQGSWVDLRFTSDYGYELLENSRNEWPHDWNEESPSSEATLLSNRSLIEKTVKDAYPNSISATEIASITDIADRTVRHNLTKLKDQGIVECLGKGPSTTWRWVK